MNGQLSQEDLGIIGRSPQIRELTAVIRRIAPTDISVLLIGESGVGKEVFAQAIQKLSRRSGARMIAINCGAIPETLLESELFGHEKGAFTGAVETRKGLFEAADGGTIFLDEIGEMSLATQVKLLRVLETLEFTRVGSTEPRRTDVRVIAATNRDLADEVRRGKFRQDLYYRLHSAQIRIPPLRERESDIPLLIAYFAGTISSRLGIPFQGITREALDMMMSYPWPGNIRELRNFLELVITVERGGKITEEIAARHLEFETRPPVVENPNAIVHLAGKTSEQVERELIYRALIDLGNEVSSLKQIILNSLDRVEATAQRPALPAPSVPQAPEDPFDRITDLNLGELEQKAIQLALKRHGNNRRNAALELGISERTLYRKLIQYRMEEGDAGEDLE